MENSRCPLRWGEPLHASLNSCVNKSLLGLITGIQVNGKERKNGFNAAKQLNEFRLIFIISLNPGDTWELRKCRWFLDLSVARVTGRS
jgi:hypothetical protein